MLSDSAVFLVGDVRLAYVIDQRCLAMIDMTHDSDYRWADTQVGGCIFGILNFKNVFTEDDVFAEFLTDQLNV